MTKQPIFHITTAISGGMNFMPLVRADVMVSTEHEGVFYCVVDSGWILPADMELFCKALWDKYILVDGKYSAPEYRVLFSHDGDELEPEEDFPENAAIEAYPCCNDAHNDLVNMVYQSKLASWAESQVMFGDNDYEVPLLDDLPDSVIGTREVKAEQEQTTVRENLINSINKLIANTNSKFTSPVIKSTIDDNISIEELTRTYNLLYDLNEPMME